VSAIESPPVRFSIVITRTGRISGAGGSAARWQDDSNATAAAASTATTAGTGRRCARTLWAQARFGSTELLPVDNLTIFFDLELERNGKRGTDGDQFRLAASPTRRAMTMAGNRTPSVDKKVASILAEVLTA